MQVATMHDLVEGRRKVVGELELDAARRWNDLRLTSQILQLLRPQILGCVDTEMLVSAVKALAEVTAQFDSS